MSESETTSEPAKNGAMLKNLLVAVAASAIVSVAGAYVAVRVMQVELQSTQSEVRTLGAAARRSDRRLSSLNTKLAVQAATYTADERRHNERWTAIQSQLGAIKSQLSKLLNRGVRVRPGR